jgi:hypothetical protein
MSQVSDRLHAIGCDVLGPEQASRYDRETLSRLPELLGARLPEDYLQFLVEFPSTLSMGAIFRGVEAPAAAHDELLVHVLYASSANPQLDLLGLRNMTLRKNFTPRHLLLIGDNLLDDCFALDLRQESLGTVYYVEHEMWEAEGLLRVAKDFTSFILGLSPSR